MITRRSIPILLTALAALQPLPGFAADLAVLRKAPPPIAEKGIWGSIAYSEADSKYGFFWGADKRQEAADEALKNCRNAKGEACRTVSIFRNHRHWDDDDKTGFPYRHCSALSLGNEVRGSVRAWGVGTAETPKQAEDQALQVCGGDARECKIQEWVCT